MSYKLSQALYQFDGRIGLNNWAPANRLLDSLCLPCQGAPRGTASSLTFLQERAEFVEEKASHFFLEQKISPMHLTPLDNGAESLVFDCGNNYILKMRHGSYNTKSLKSKRILPAETRGYSQKLNVSFEIFQKADKSNIVHDDTRSMFRACLSEGIWFCDRSVHNLARIKSPDSNERKMVIIDEGAALRLYNPYVAYRFIRRKIQMKCPRLFRHVARFEQAMHDMISPAEKTYEKIPFSELARASDEKNEAVARPLVRSLPV